MLALLWNYLMGYVIISVYGFSTERFLNLLGVKNILAWDITRKNGGIVCKIRTQSLDEAEKYAKKTGCKIEVLGRRGLPQKMGKFKGRKIFAAGVIFFAAAFYGLSLFVWRVEISGCERIDEEDIKIFCQNEGLAAGEIKLKINPKQISEKLVENFEDVLWAAVKIDGTNAEIKIVETIEEREIVDRQTPVDIVAKQNGVIKSIAASAGKPRVKAGDVVAKGDLLISSEVEIKDGEEIKGYTYTAAEGSVVAEVIYEISAYTDKTKTEKIFTGEKFSDTAVIFGNSSSNIIKPDLDGKNYDTFVSEDIRLKIGDYSFPLGIKKYEYRVYYNEEKKLTQKEIEEILISDIENKLEELTEVDSIVLDKKFEYNTEGKGVRLNAKISVSESIAQKDFNIRRSASGGNEGENARN